LRELLVSVKDILFDYRERNLAAGEVFLKPGGERKGSDL